MLKHSQILSDIYLLILYIKYRNYTTYTYDNTTFKIVRLAGDCQTGIFLILLSLNTPISSGLI